MPDAYDRITLLCRLKAAQTRNKELESGERYVRLKELHQKECRGYGSRILELQKEAADAHKETIRVRNYWFQVLEDMLLEFEKMQKKTKQELQEMEKRALKAEKQRDDALDKVKELQHQFYETAVRLEEEQGKNLKLRAQINRDYENSSIPSSKTLRKKKITNSREKTGRKPGGQPGHKGHCRKKQSRPGRQSFYRLRAFLFLLNNDCCTSIDKSRQFLSDLTFYNYGTDHQECLAHVLRYLKGSMDNEPDRTWNKDMHSLVQEMIHFRNGLQPSEEPDPCKVSEFEERYRKILETARKEYEDVPANDYYRDGYNLFLRMEKYMQNHLLLLHDLRVPATNNEAERLLRNYKRKQAQAVTFRSFESIDYLCQCMSMLVLMRLEEPENIFDRVSRIFG